MGVGGIDGGGRIDRAHQLQAETVHTPAADAAAVEFEEITKPAPGTEEGAMGDALAAKTGISADDKKFEFYKPGAAAGDEKGFTYQKPGGGADAKTTPGGGAPGSERAAYNSYSKAQPGGERAALNAYSKATPAATRGVEDTKLASSGLPTGRGADAKSGEYLPAFGRPQDKAANAAHKPITADAQMHKPFKPEEGVKQLEKALQAGDEDAAAKLAEKLLSGNYGPQIMQQVQQMLSGGA